MSEKKAAVEVKQEGEFTLKGKLKPKSKVKNLGKSNNEPVKIDLTKPEAQGEVIPEVTKVDLTKKSGKGPLAKKTPMFKKTKYSKANPHPRAGSKNAKGTKVVDTQGNCKRINPLPPKK